MNVVFRVDASVQIGSGHVMRSASLAGELRHRGATVSFICRQMPGDLVEWLTSHGMPVEPLDQGPLSGKDFGNAGPYAHWLGAPMELEIEQVRQCLANLGETHWLVVDHYALDATWEKAMRTQVERILCIDDLANRAHDCDMLLDQNYFNSPELRYEGLVPPHAVTLLGPQYALLRPEFAFQRLNLRTRDGAVKRILVFMGGSDTANVTATVLRALTQCRPGMHEKRIDVVVGKANPHLREIEALCTELSGARLYNHVDNMAELIAAADLCIGATGTSTWERAALGVPTLAVSVAENQRDIACYAAQRGVLAWLGDAQVVSIPEWKTRIEEACSSPDTLRSQSCAGLALVDGKGAARVGERML